MNDAEQELLDWAVLGRGVLDVPISNASDEAVLALMSSGLMKQAEDQPSPDFIRYELTEAAGFNRKVGLRPLPDIPTDF